MRILVLLLAIALSSGSQAQYDRDGNTIRDLDLPSWMLRALGRNVSAKDGAFIDRSFETVGRPRNQFTGAFTGRVEEVDKGTFQPSGEFSGWADSTRMIFTMIRYGADTSTWLIDRMAGISVLVSTRNRAITIQQEDPETGTTNNMQALQGHGAMPLRHYRNTRDVLGHPCTQYFWPHPHDTVHYWVSDIPSSPFMDLAESVVLQPVFVGEMVLRMTLVGVPMPLATWSKNLKAEITAVHRGPLPMPKLAFKNCRIDERRPDKDGRYKEMLTNSPRRGAPPPLIDGWIKVDVEGRTLVKKPTIPAAGWKCSVTMQVQVDAKGAVHRVNFVPGPVSCGTEDLVRKARVMCMQLQFNTTPDQPRDQWGTVTFDFPGKP